MTIKQNTVLSVDGECPYCQWPLIDCCGNFHEKVEDKHGELIGDWFMYCSNKACLNHQGVWYSQEDPMDLLREE